MTEIVKCELCGEPMPKGEEMFKFHGYSGPCPKPHLHRPVPQQNVKAIKEAQLLSLLEEAWGIIANAGGGDWSRESEQWREAAVAFRQKYLA